MKFKRILTSGILAGAMLALPMTAPAFAEPAYSANSNYVERVNWWHHDYDDHDGYRNRGYYGNRYYGNGYYGYRNYGYGNRYGYGYGRRGYGWRLRKCSTTPESGAERSLDGPSCGCQRRSRASCVGSARTAIANGEQPIPSGLKCASASQPGDALALRVGFPVRKERSAEFLDLGLWISRANPGDEFFGHRHRRQTSLPDQRPVVELPGLFDLRQSYRRIEASGEFQIHDR